MALKSQQNATATADYVRRCPKFSTSVRF